MAQNLKINILAQDKTKAALNGVRARLAGLKNAVFSLKGAFVGLGAGLVVKSFVTTGKSIEDLQVRLKQLFGTQQEGAKAFDVMAKFAAKVPFSLEQIQAASGNLAVVAGDAERLSKILEIYLTKGSNCIDVGANIGFFTYFTFIFFSSESNSPRPFFRIFN